MSSFLHRADVADPGIGSLPGQEPIRAKRSMSDSRRTCMVATPTVSFLPEAQICFSDAMLASAQSSRMMILRMIRWTWSSHDVSRILHVLINL